MDTPGPSSELVPPPSGPAPPPTVPAVALTPDEVRRIANEVATFLRENSTPLNPLASASLPADANPGNSSGHRGSVLGCLAKQGRIREFLFTI